MNERQTARTVSTVAHAWVGVLITLAAVLAPLAAAAGADTIKISLPRHIKIGRALSIKVSGVASEPVGTAQIDLGGNRRKCRSSFQAEQRLPDFGIFTPVFAHGHFKQIFHISYPESTHGPQYFCAYLTVPTAKFSTTTRTVAHASLRYRIPA